MQRSLVLNECKVLNALRTYGEMTRSHISQRTGLSQTTISEIVERLVLDGLVITGEGASSGGRKPIVYRINGDACYAIGIDIGTVNIRIAIVDAAGTVISSIRGKRCPDSERRMDIDNVISLALELVERQDVPRGLLKGIGIGVTGIVDETSGTSLFVPGWPCWRDYPVVETFRHATGLSSVILTDSARAMALSESRYGLGKALTDFVLVNIGVGLGAGIMVDGKLVTGYRGISGELGHIYVGRSDEICVCGNYGCLESVASGWALTRHASEDIADGVITSIDDFTDPADATLIPSIIKAAGEGDKYAVNLLDQAADHLSIGVSTLINLLNPQRIIIAGGFAQGAGSLLMDSLIRRTKARSLPWLRPDIDMRLSELGEFSATRGAATLALDHFFKHDASMSSIET